MKSIALSVVATLVVLAVVNRIPRVRDLVTG